MQNSRPALIYLHGFMSSPASQKVEELKTLLPRLNARVELVVPTLGLDPTLAFQAAFDAYNALAGRPCGVIGSSLGGYYATALSERTGCRAALINPAVYPYRLLSRYLGHQTNPYTGESLTLTAYHMDALRGLDPGTVTYPERLLQVLQAGDETLDFREALARHPKSPAWVQPGGDHRFQHFDRVVPALLAFFGVSCHP